MKVIFLDFNGVLDTWDNIDVVNSNCMNVLKRIVHETNAKIVLTTSNKKSFVETGKPTEKLIYILDSLAEAGIDVIGCTPNAETREKEILEYLNSHPNINKFVIIDDDYNMTTFGDSMIKLPTQSKEFPNGLTLYSATNVINVLNKVMNEYIYNDEVFKLVGFQIPNYTRSGFVQPVFQKIDDRDYNYYQQSINNNIVELKPSVLRGRLINLNAIKTNDFEHSGCISEQIYAFLNLNNSITFGTKEVICDYYNSKNYSDLDENIKSFIKK